MLWWLLIVLIIILVYVKLYRPHQHWKEKNVEYIKPLPIVGTMSGIAFRTMSMPDWLTHLYKQCNNRYIGTYMFLQPTLLIKDIDLIKQVAIKDFDHFVDRLVLLTEDTEPLFGRNLFALKGHKWRNMRATLSPAFTGSKMRSMFVLITECAEQFTNYFMEHTDPNQVMEIEMKDACTRFTNDAIATCAFGVKCDSLEKKENEFYMMGKRTLNFTGWQLFKFTAYMLAPAIMNFFKVKIFNKRENDFFLDLVKTTMEVREKEGIIRPDMIHLLMEARKGTLKHEDTSKSSDTGFATVKESQVGYESVEQDLSDNVVTAQALIFFVAGFETSATLMCFMAHELAVNEDVQRRLQNEIDVTFQQCNGKLSYEALLKMQYLDMVVSETLRKWPPASGIDRACVKPYTIQPVGENEVPIHFEIGDIIWFPIFAIHRDPQYYPDPDKFDPERFSDERRDQINQFSYLPFGIGPRNCIGSRFALLETKALFAHLLRKFDLVVIKKTPIPLTLSKNQLSMAPENGFWVGLKQRTKLN